MTPVAALTTLPIERPNARSAARLHSSTSARFRLSPREREVLGLLTEGLTNHEIGRHLFISEETVKSHVRSILRKLGVQDRVQALALTLREERASRVERAGGIEADPVLDEVLAARLACL